jgi:hypothetical protein
MKRLAALLILPLTAACAPTISDYSGDSVTIKTGWATNADSPSVISQAAKVCGADGRQPQFVTTSREYDPFTGGITNGHLFLCRT